MIRRIFMVRKKYKYLVMCIITITVMFIIAGCGTDNDQDSRDTNNNENEEQNNQSGNEEDTSDNSMTNDNANDETEQEDRKSTRLNSSHVAISYADCCLKKKRLQGDIEGEVTLSHSVRDTIGSQFDTGPVGFDGHEYYIWKSRLTKVTVAIGMS